MKKQINTDVMNSAINPLLQFHTYYWLPFSLILILGGSQMLSVIRITGAIDNFKK